MKDSAGGELCFTVTGARALRTNHRHWGRKGHSVAGANAIGKGGGEICGEVGRCRMRLWDEVAHIPGRGCGLGQRSQAFPRPFYNTII